MKSLDNLNPGPSELTARERLERIFRGESIDRIATYDILHNTDLIEYVTGNKITPQNAEDLLCLAANKCVDLIRHFAVPDYTGEKIVKCSDGFVYRYEWWTGHIIEKPGYDSVEDVARIVEKDTEELIKCTAEKRICQEANNHVNLFYEKFEYFEEIRNEYRRISEKLGEKTLMLGPEMPMGYSIAMFRHGIDWWTFLNHDLPEVVRSYLKAYLDYELAFVDSYVSMKEMPIVCSAGSIGMDDRLLFPVDVYHDIIIKSEKQIYQKFKENGKYIIAFLDGYKLPVINDFIEIGADAVDPFEPYCKMDVADFRKQHPETVICQPVDCTQLLAFGPGDKVRNTVIKAIEDAQKRKILIGSTSEIHPGVNFRNALAMYDTARHYTL